MIGAVLTKIASAVGIGLITIASWLGVATNLGVALPGGEALFETALQERISSTDTSMTLVSNSVRGGGSLSGYNCFTIDEGRSDAEFVCGTVSGTTVSGLERGVSPSTGTSTVSSLRFSHRVGANVKITDFPLIQRLRNLSNGIEAFPNLLSYSTTTTDCGALTADDVICDKEYVDSVAVAGASNANTTTKGIVEIGTDAENAAGSSTGGTGAVLVAPSSSHSSTAGASKIPVAQTDGKLASGWFGQVNATSSTITESFTVSSTATSTIGVNGTTTVGDLFQYSNWGGIAPTGSVMAYASSTAPAGWLTLDGSAVSRSTYKRLFSIIGTKYGTGDGSTTFNLPDLRGRNILMASTTANLATTGGESNHTLTTTEIPAHTHGQRAFNGLSDGGTTSHAGVRGSASDVDLSEDTDSTGGGAAHNVLDPYIALWYIIKF